MLPVLPGQFGVEPVSSLVLKALAHKTLVLLLGVDPSRQLDHPLPTGHPQVTYAYMKNMWKSARKVRAPPGRGPGCRSAPGSSPLSTVSAAAPVGRLLGAVAQRASCVRKCTCTADQTEGCNPSSNCSQLECAEIRGKSTISGEGGGFTPRRNTPKKQQICENTDQNLPKTHLVFQTPCLPTYHQLLIQKQQHPERDAETGRESHLEARGGFL